MTIQSLAASSKNAENKEGILTTCENKPSWFQEPQDCDLQVNSQASEGSSQEGKRPERSSSQGPENSITMIEFESGKKMGLRLNWESCIFKSLNWQVNT